MPTLTPDALLLSRAAAGNLAKVQEALALGANVNVQHRQHHTPLMRAVKNGHETVARALLGAGADPNLAQFNVGTPLHALVWNPSPSMAGHAAVLRLVTLLVMHGADLNRYGPNGETPLISAQSHGNLPLVQHLLDLGADPNRCARSALRTVPGQPKGPRQGVSPLTQTMRGDFSAMDPVRLLMLNALLAAGADVNALDGDGNLPLYSAVSARVPLPVVQRLLDAGADPTCPGIRDRNSLEENLEQRGLPEVRRLFEAMALRQAMAGMDMPAPALRVPRRL